MSTMMLAISGEWGVDKRVAAVGDLARHLGHEVLLVHVIYGSEHTTEEQTAGERTLDNIAKHLKGLGVKVETLLLFSDDVADALLKTADEHRVNIIMMGLSTKGMLARLIEGAIPQQIIKATRLPVLLLPPDWQGTL